MTHSTREIGVRVERPAAVVYDYAADPGNLHRWAAGLAGSPVEQDGDRWAVDSPMGRITFTFSARNDDGVLDHDVTLPSGETVHNQLRVHPDGDACQVVFTLRQRPGVTDADLDADAAAVASDLRTLKALLEA